MIAEGKKAPAFTLEADDGSKVSLKSFRGQSLVLYFYPKDNTPGCTVEAQEFNKALKKLEARNAEVVGISRDSLASHCKFRDKYKLKFPLLSDPDCKVIEKYGAWGEKNMYGKKMMGIIRTTVIVDPDGKIKKIFPKVRVKGHVDDVLAALTE